jgi:hypothetical protein
MLIEGLQLHALRADATPSKLSVYTSYEEAQELEAEIVQMYREIRAAELSLIQRQTLERSLESTLTPLSERAKVDPALLTDSAKDAETVKDYQQELSLVLRETDSIVSNANELLASFIKEPKSQESSKKAQEELTPEEIAVMATQSESAIEAIEAMLNSMQEGQLLSDDQSITQQQSLGALANAGSGKWLDITDQMRGRNLGQKPIEVPAAQRPDLWKDRKELDVLQSARKVITSSDRGGDWIFLGDWYVLSRYDNAHRANRQKVYPPESILDLDAGYLSEDGQPMRWEYESFSPPYMRPFGEQSWKIYYFYTELYFEEASEAWLAIGSDDRSDIWINDLPVWHSSNQHKNWNPVEGFRKVYFKQGRNKVLVRLENGQSGLGLSIYMRLDR